MEEKKEILEDLIFNQKLSYLEIGRRYKCSGTYVKKYAKKLGIELPQRRVINKKEKFNKGKTLTNTKVFTTECKFCNKKVVNKKYPKIFCDKTCESDYKKEKTRERVINEEWGDWNQQTIDRFSKRYIIERDGEKCSKCGWCEINEHTNKIPLELEHIDGNPSNHSLDNLTLLCPNCHSLTKSYKGANKGNGRNYRRKRYNEGKTY